MEIIKTAEGWRTTELSGLVVEHGGVQTGPFGTQLHQKDYVDEGTPIITVEHLGDNKILHNDPPCVSDSDKERLSKYSLRSGDIVFSRVGSVDRRALVRDAEDGWLFSGRCLRVRTQPEKIDSAFLSYYLGHESVKKYIRAVAVGATMPSINTKILSQLPVSYPPKLEDQKAIAHILGTLDDKIELNQKMNQTLEDIAKAIFKSWFVNFDPVRAKAEGRPTGLSKEISDLFPDSFEDSELGKIPCGWSIKKINDIFDVKKGSTPATKNTEFWDAAEYEWISPKDLSQSSSIYLFHSARKVSNLGLQKIRSGLLSAGTVMMSSRAPIGLIGISGVDASVGTGIFAISPNNIMSSGLIYLLVNNQIRNLKQLSIGSTFEEVSLKIFNNLMIVFPNEEILINTKDIFDDIFKKIKVNTIEIENLINMRDLLLPKLISGELSISDTDKFLEEAGI